MKPAQIQLFRPSDTPLQIGTVVTLENGKLAKVVARFTPKDRPGEIGYLLSQADADSSSST